MKKFNTYIIEKLKLNKDSKIDSLDELVENIMLICAVKFENKWHPEVAADRESEFRDSLKTALNKYNIHKLEDFDLFTDYRGDITKLKNRYKELGIKENENYPIKVKDNCFDHITYRNQDVIFNGGGFYMSIVSSNSIFIQYQPNPSYAANYRILFKIKDK
jgi:hypothetical protein